MQMREVLAVNAFCIFRKAFDLAVVLVLSGFNC